MGHGEQPPEQHRNLGDWMQAFRCAGIDLTEKGRAGLAPLHRAYSKYVTAISNDSTMSPVQKDIMMTHARREYEGWLSDLLGDDDESDDQDDEFSQGAAHCVPHAPEDVIIGNDVNSGEPVALPYERRDLGVTIIGRSGTGKSSLLEHLILADLKQGTPGVVIDPHGKLANRVITLAPSSAARRIMLLEPSVTKPFGLNLLSCRKEIDDDDDPVSWAADSVVETVKKLYGEQDKYLPRLEHYLDLAARTLIPNNRTLADAPRLFRNEIFRKECLKHVADRDVREDWKLYDSLRTTDQVTHIEAVINRLSRLLKPKVIQGIVGSRQTTVPFEEVLDGDTMLIVSLPSERLTPARCNFIGAMVLCALADRVFARTVTREVPRLHLYLDEYQRFATSTTAELLTQGRKYGVGVTLAHQGRGLIGDTGVSDAELQAGTLIILGVTRQDADVLAGELPVTQREEWIERVTEPDGTEPEMVPTRTPGAHLSSNGHRNPAAAAAARQLFDATFERPGQRVDSDMPHVAVRPDDPAINQLLVDIMDGKLIDTERLRCRLLDIAFLFAQGASRDGTITYSGSLVPQRYHDLRYLHGWHGDWYDQTDIPEVMTQLEAWLDVYLRHRYLTEKQRPIACGLADSKLYSYVKRQQEADDSWTATTWVEQRRAPSIRRELVDDSTKKERLKTLQQTTEVLGRRLHALLVLCEKLSSDPILVPSGQQKARIRTHLVVHPRQPELDARNELAGRLVNPRKEYVAHARLPGGQYHEAELSKPVSGVGDFDQLEEVRRRSQSKYAIPSPGDVSGDDKLWCSGKNSDTSDDGPPTIGRRSPK